MFVFLLCIYLWYAVGTSYSVMYMIYLLVGVHTCSENDESSRKMLFVPCSGSWCSLYKLHVYELYVRLQGFAPCCQSSKGLTDTLWSHTVWHGFIYFKYNSSNACFCCLLVLHLHVHVAAGKKYFGGQRRHIWGG